MYDLQQLFFTIYEKGTNITMKNITNNSELTRTVNGGSLGIDVLAAMGLIYGSYEACKWAWETGTWLGTKIGKALFK